MLYMSFQFGSEIFLIPADLYRFLGHTGKLEKSTTILFLLSIFVHNFVAKDNLFEFVDKIILKSLRKPYNTNTYKDKYFQGKGQHKSYLTHRIIDSFPRVSK